MGKIGAGEWSYAHEARHGATGGKREAAAEASAQEHWVDWKRCKCMSGCVQELRVRAGVLCAGLASRQRSMDGGVQAFLDRMVARIGQPTTSEDVRATGSESEGSLCEPNSVDTGALGAAAWNCRRRDRDLAPRRREKSRHAEAQQQQLGDRAPVAVLGRV